MSWMNNSSCLYSIGAAYGVIDGNKESERLIIKFKNTTELTTEQFEKYVLNKKENKEMKKFPIEISAEDMKTIFNSNICSGWKEKLAELFGKEMMLNEPCSISEELYNEGRRAADSDQNRLLDKIFGEDKPKYQEGKVYLCTSKYSGSTSIKLYIKGYFKSYIGISELASNGDDYSKIEPLTADYLPE